MRYTRLRVWIIFFAVAVGVVVLLKWSAGSGVYRSSSPVQDTLLTATYPDLYDALYSRDAHQLKPFLSHMHPQVRAQAWRALAHTPVDTLSGLIGLAKQQNSRVAWFGLSMSDLSEPQLRNLEQSWSENPALRSGIARVLGRQGDEQSLRFLLKQLEFADEPKTYHYALAVGRLIGEFEISEEQQIRVIQQAFEASTDSSRRAYLYGWYRGDEGRLTAAAQDTLFTRWQVMGSGIEPELDQTVNGILPERTTYPMVIYYNGEQLLDNEIQLAVELASSIAKVEMDNQNALAAKILLTNPNPHVQISALKNLKGKLVESRNLYGYITGSMLPDSTLDDAVWLQALQTSLTEDPAMAGRYRGRLKEIPQENSYLWPEVLSVYEQSLTAGKYFEQIGSIFDGEETLPKMFALQSLSRYWQQLKDPTDGQVEQVRNFIFEALALHDRGISYTAQALLKNPNLVAVTDFNRINDALTEFSLPEDIEVYQVFGELYKEQFEQQGKKVIDSLAAYDYAPLNRSLAAVGWDVAVPNAKTEFRKPNWERLWELGRHPVWTLKTEKGDIEIQLHTLSAPATVSVIDSLSRAGAYDDIPFHRVIPNFVIQGGDIERQDGFGGPDFVIPTEASEQEFVRGAVGIASAGPDTEGSQYFIMHQWKPHLNGRYTRFGKVIEGMNVVDQIQRGDRVLSTEWH